MENPLAKFVPQLFGEYPKPFLKLINNVSFLPDQDSKEETEVLWKAYEFGLRYHDGQKRLSGRPYFSHCLAVASTLASWKMDLSLIHI